MSLFRVSFSLTQQARTQTSLLGYNISRTLSSSARCQNEDASKFELTNLAKRFLPKDTYAPSDFNENIPRNRSRRKGQNDPFRQLHLNPLSEYKNTTLLSNYVSQMGRILPRTATGLSAKSQRKVGKAIRRARAMGLMPVTWKQAPLFEFGNRSNRM
ncbi:ribosomal protein S18 [Basidiobolus meristosporus CBS 931.73]|uniref:Small ribosomal subunit protein bS18m n=1 Tax=Basidiobolus meristosporus CBS 931.73 TaxID=1314790 RepID=A0A1Y1YNL0_9FUNG|nr:ribosomal protein S18 [Basidiobolus meristosporus CBS 931.73]|eukprot:ORX99591.1 ribosomal protein S18 [Basidiobolus meristosporus CBS 931.73]